MKFLIQILLFSIVFFISRWLNDITYHTKTNLQHVLYYIHSSGYCFLHALFLLTWLLLSYIIESHWEHWENREKVKEDNREEEKSFRLLVSWTVKALAIHFDIKSDICKKLYEKFVWKVFLRCVRFFILHIAGGLSPSYYWPVETCALEGVSITFSWNSWYKAVLTASISWSTTPWQAYHDLISPHPVFTKGPL